MPLLVESYQGVLSLDDLVRLHMRLLQVRARLGSLVSSGVLFGAQDGGRTHNIYVLNVTPLPGWAT